MCIFSNNPLRESYSHHIPLPLNTSMCVSKSKELSYIARVQFSKRKKIIKSLVQYNKYFLSIVLEMPFVAL